MTAEGNGWVMTLVWLAGHHRPHFGLCLPTGGAIHSDGGDIVRGVSRYWCCRFTFPEPHCDRAASHRARSRHGRDDRRISGGGCSSLVQSARGGTAQKPVLGTGWQKWLFIGPAAFWILGLTVFPLAYAITTSRYAFRTGKIVKDVGWGNYRKLFNDVLFDPATRGQAIMHTVLVGVGAALAVLLIGGIIGLLSDERSFVQSARRAHDLDSAGGCPGRVAVTFGRPKCPADHLRTTPAAGAGLG